MVHGFSAGRCTSTKELTDAEATLMLRHLQAHDPQRPAIEKMKGKLFYYCHEMGWTKINDAGKKVVDMQRLDNWCRQYSYLKKKLDWYRYAELPKLVSQFEQVYNHFIHSLKK